MLTGRKTTIEVCVDSVTSARNALAGGADRVELCDNLVEGGTTPSAGMIKTIREQVSIGLQVMIRPRGGDFLYDEDEFRVMQEDVRQAKSLGADGVVFGLLMSDGNIDRERTQQLIELARPMEVTFHRAFDMVSDASRALEDLISIGVDRVLTSGLEANVVEGAAQLTALVQQAGDRIVILAGGGVRVDNIKSLVEQTGVREIHISARQTIDSQMNYRNHRVKMGAIPDAEYQNRVVDVSIIRQFLALLS
ncbi:copper homeostasis protein CutC [Reichenbachiella sp. MSK19-1]|uniref:copper homeostasis protein CutC n=1 Tax=Reichenbachiella sp. MSK19-1 TaxID=1897631 RepID=UPI000E6D4CE2|nr:copper homeostasis protein CutC [Reichenbachiella sp. MSK19-1]RJE71517.1 copper homeostasis protein CutC [Reichenbachiella sp. MSK19-1]